MRTYRLRSLMVVVVLASVVACVAVQQVRQASLRGALAQREKELAHARRESGEIRVHDPTKVYALPRNRSRTAVDAMRLHIPAGARYVLCLADCEFVGGEIPADPVPTKSLVLDRWQNGADVALATGMYWPDTPPFAPRVLVHRGNSVWMQYEPIDWPTGDGTMSSSTLYGGSPLQQEYEADERIVLNWWRDSDTNRGVLIWLEPQDHWEQRMDQQADREEVSARISK